MLAQTFRDVLPKAKALGGRVVDQLDDIIAQFSGLWSVQHNEDGTHGDITADSLVVSGDTTFEGNVTGGAGVSAVLDNIRLRGADNNGLGYVSFLTDEEAETIFVGGASIGRTQVSAVDQLYSQGNWIPSQSLTYSLGLASRVWSSFYTLVINLGGLSGTVIVAYDLVRDALSSNKNFVPTADDSFDLGWTNGISTQHWRSLFLSASVNMGEGVGHIVFPSTPVPSANQNTLDTYAEGSWTPVLEFGGASTGITYSTQTGSYVKVGKLVTVSMNITLTSKGSSTGLAAVNGLPFTVGKTGLGPTSFQNMSANVWGLKGVAVETTASVLFQYDSPPTVVNTDDTDFTNTSILIWSASYIADA